MQEKLERYKKIAQQKQQIVSVFMLTYNREHYVQLAIQGVLEQTYENFQLIVLDNCSEDNTEQVITSIDDERITYIKRAHTPEMSNGLLALTECVTKYVIILHDDDVVNPTYLEEMLDLMEREELTAASAGATVIDGEGVPYAEYLLPYDSEVVIFQNKDYISHYLQMKYVGMTYPSAVYRSDFYKDFENPAGNPKVGPAGDQWIWFETERLGGKLAFVNKPLFQYRVHRTQESNRHAGEMELMLMDHLLTKPYYRDILLEQWDKFCNAVWIGYLERSRKYHRGQVDAQQYSRCVRHSCIKFLTKRPKGLLLYAKIMLSYYLRAPLHILLKVVGKI